MLRIRKRVLNTTVGGKNTRDGDQAGCSKIHEAYK